MTLATVVVLLTGGSFPSGALLLGVLVAATGLEPRDVAIVGFVQVVGGSSLAHYSGGFDGAELFYRSLFFVIAAALGVVLASLRTNRERELTRSRRLNTLHDFATTLFAEPDIEGISRVVTNAAAPLLGATRAQLMVVDGDRLVLVGVVDELDATAGGVVALSSPGAVTTAVRENRPLYFESHAVYANEHPEWASTVNAMGGGAFAVVPMSGNGPVVATLILFFSEPREFSEDDRVTVEQVAREIGVAIERALLREREQAAAVKLQQSLLGPPILVEGVGHEARYLPAEAALHVGGDWYNAQRLADGRVGIAVGDVVGRGLEAATVMGQLRSALSAFADRSSTPAETLTHLDRFATQVPGAASTSVAFARVDIWGRTIEYSCAGHPPPVLVTPSGEVSLLDDAIGWPLAIRDTAIHERPTAARPFPAGSTILLYSDGLVERRGERLDVGLERLLGSARRNWKLPLPLLCDALIAENLAGRRRADDVALLALRSPASIDALFLLKERASSDGLSKMRAQLREWLSNRGIDGNDAYAILVAVGEAAMNSVEHAYSEGGGLLRIEATDARDEIICCVTDTGAWHDNAARATRGNGLPIMKELMHDVTIDRRSTGTSVTLRYRIVNRAAA
jgi:anti-sigma regulatory factor (Ser/Thr protein kinase)